MHYEISEDLYNGLMQYLQTRPVGEVWNAFEIMRVLQPVQDSQTSVSLPPTE